MITHRNSIRKHSQIILLLRVDLTVIGFVSYILLTEMLVPSFIIKKIINNGGRI